jgi:PBP1b-binding outer membrane lipoprotein LpoB
MRKIIPLILFFILLLAACSSIDCPLNNSVYTRYKLAGDVTTLKDTLTISTNISQGSDSVLINKDVSVDSFSLPVSYERAEDTFFFEIKDTNSVTTLDTVTVAKENKPHFESIDCNPSIFHTITSIKYTHNRIDSIAIINKNVTYDASQAHFHIYFKSSN